MAGVVVRRLEKTDLGAINALAATLHPEWFTEEALRNIPRDMQFARGYVAVRSGAIVGFISVQSHDGKPMIGWLGVGKKERGRGTGRALVGHVCEELRSHGYRDVRVETVGECTPIYEPYAQTLRFYESMGFTMVKKGRLRHDLGFAWRYSTLRKKL